MFEYVWLLHVVILGCFGLMVFRVMLFWWLVVLFVFVVVVLRFDLGFGCF